MSEITWESLRPELQTALRTLAEGRRIDSALENELEDLGLAEYVQGAHATWATDKGYALLPAGEAVVEKQSYKKGDEVITDSEGWGIIQSGNDDSGYDVGFSDILIPDKFPAHIMHFKVSQIMPTPEGKLQADLAAALARAQAAEALLGTFGFIWHEWEATEDQRMGFSDWLHQHLDENPYLVDKFKAVDEHIRAVRIENLK